MKQCETQPITHQLSESGTYVHVTAGRLRCRRPCGTKRAPLMDRCRCFSSSFSFWKRSMRALFFFCLSHQPALSQRSAAKPKPYLAFWLVLSHSSSESNILLFALSFLSE